MRDYQRINVIDGVSLLSKRLYDAVTAVNENVLIDQTAGIVFRCGYVSSSNKFYFHVFYLHRYYI